MNQPERRAYFVEHEWLYADVVASFDSALRTTDDNSRACLFRNSTMCDFAFLEGKATAEDCANEKPPEGEDYWPSNPAVIAEEQNGYLLRRANDSLRTLRLQANYLRPNNLPPRFDVDGMPILMPYRTAVWRHCVTVPDEEDGDDPTPRGIVSALDLYGVGDEQEIAVAAFYELNHDLKGVRDLLRVTSITVGPNSPCTL